MWIIDFCTELGEEVETSFGECPHCETDECLLHDWKDVAEYWREHCIVLQKALGMMAGRLWLVDGMPKPNWVILYTKYIKYAKDEIAKEEQCQTN